MIFSLPCMNLMFAFIIHIYYRLSGIKTFFFFSLTQSPAKAIVLPRMVTLQCSCPTDPKLNRLIGTEILHAGCWESIYLSLFY